MTDTQAKKKLPWGLTKAATHEVKETVVDIDDHLGKSCVSFTQWSNGEGGTLHVFSYGKESCEERIDLTWTQLRAVQVIAKMTGDR